MMRLRGHGGQAILEVAVGLLIVKALTGLFLVATYGAYARWWLDRHLYEALVCVSFQPETHCRRRFADRRQKELPFGQVSELRLRSASDEFRGEVRWRLNRLLSLNLKRSIARRNLWR